MTGIVMTSPPKNSPQKPPQNAPEFDPVAEVIEADDLFIGMVALPDDAEILYLETGTRQFFHSSFCRFVVGEDGDDSASCFHVILFQGQAAPTQPVASFGSDMNPPAMRGISFKPGRPEKLTLVEDAPA